MTTAPLPAALHAERAADIRQRFAEQRAGGLRAKEAAQACGVSEGEALAAHAWQLGDASPRLQSQPLRPEWLAILQALQACGPVMALTRNTGAVHEKTGIYAHASANGEVGLVLNHDIDLRLFFAHWHAGYAVAETSAWGSGAVLRSLQFFDRKGCAVHKVFARDATDLAAWNALVERFAQPAEAPAASLPGFEPPVPRKPVAVPPDADIDVPALQSAWAAMQDTHEFFGLLKQSGAERQQAFRLVQDRFAWPLATDSVARLLHEAAFAATPIMVFVGSGGCIQIHSGPVQRVQPTTAGPAEWINVLDEGFNLHLRTDLLAHAWLVEKPTSDGPVTSVEVFDAHGELMAMFFGARKPGQPELAAWRALAASLPRLAGEAAAVAA